MSKIVSLQLLRGVAATTVAGFHLCAAAIENNHDPGFFRVFSGGEIGVDIFFVISGFIIFYASQGRSDLTAWQFLQARFWRIIPPYWAILSLYILAAIALSLISAEVDTTLTWRSLIVSYLMLPYPDHIIIIAWTLALEVLFYLLFALSFFGGSARRLFIALGLWVIASQLALHFGHALPIWSVIPLHSAVMEFMFGALIGYAFCNAPERLRRVRLPAVLLGGGAVSAYMVGYHIETSPWGREISAGVPSALLVLGALGFTLDRKPVLETWGESSYILYLFHLLYFATFGTLVRIWLGVDVYASQVWMLFMLITVLVICYGATINLERPYQRWYRRFLPKKLS